MQLIPTLTLSLAALATAASAFKLEVWDKPQFTGKRVEYRREGNYHIGFPCDSYKYDEFKHENCCVRFCHGKDKVSETCSDKEQPNAAKQFNRVSIACHGRKTTCHF